MMVLGPLGWTAPLVIALAMAALWSMWAAGICSRAAMLRRPLLFLVAWMAMLAGVTAVRLSFESLLTHGPERSLADALMPWTATDVAALLQANATPAALLVALGVVIALIIAVRPGPSGRAIVAPLQFRAEPSSVALDDRATKIGRAGELLVACELAALGWPVLHNVILSERYGRLVEIDHVVRAPGGIVVLETKTYSGLVTGGERSLRWTQHHGGGRKRSFLNPTLQNEAHLRALERFLGAGAALLHGLVVSAGQARFAAPIADVPVPLADLRRMLLAEFGEPRGSQNRLDAAWRRLTVEAMTSEGRREAHGAYVRRRRSGWALWS